MDPDKTIRYTTILLALTAGYCDTVTFIAADQLFSAHVTGNFIVMAYDIVKNANFQAWVKLSTFPVFVASVIAGGYISARSSNKYLLLLIEGALLTLIGIADFGLRYFGTRSLQWQDYTLALFIVLAMGLQNAFGKIFSKETFGPTTMMTGNVTQAALDLGSIIFGTAVNTGVTTSFKHQLTTILGFLFGCIAGGFIAEAIGLAAVVIPGLALFAFSVKCYAQKVLTV